jgi:mRNA-degrading endonuclease RelE of RelBE toxin-antitoxin system
MGLTMNVSQAMISSKDTQSALEAIWNKIDEKKQNQPYRCDSALKKKDGLEGCNNNRKSFYWILYQYTTHNLTILWYTIN